MQSNILKLMILTSFDFLDGQKIAKKLSVQISKETKKIKVLIPDYNTCRTIQGEAMISLQEALDPVALSQTMYSESLHPSKSRQEITDAYLMIKRTTEEISMLRNDIFHTIKYYDDLKNAVEKALLPLSVEQDCFSRGAVSLLKSKKEQIQRMKEELDRMNSSFQAIHGSENFDISSISSFQLDQDLDSDTEYVSDTDEDF